MSIIKIFPIFGFRAGFINVLFLHLNLSYMKRCRLGFGYVCKDVWKYRCMVADNYSYNYVMVFNTKSHRVAFMIQVTHKLIKKLNIS